ncbi:MAG TPA: A/G-specific adenine glycosylase [Acidimicrobiales bacterium]|nr:A/G-specific adenine glycosylase [Acidimicrobiales bacterium]
MTEGVHPAAAQGALLAWGDAQLRPLPWRATRDPWAVLVSELMAQQTGVDRVVPKWHAFLDRWPDPAACAASPLGEVLELWAGLGYPRRARNLHLAAGRIVADHGGRLPDDLVALLALPGVGPYTARAVLAFAFERDVGVVDTNVGRVLARWCGRRLAPRAAQELADACVPAGAGWAWNQSLMELGARVCRPRAPRCDECPLAPSCAWRAAGRPDPDPAVGSAGVSGRQAAFAGSDRQARGRLLAALVAGPVAPGAVAAGAGLSDDPDRAGRVGDSLVADGLEVRRPDGWLVRP